MFETIWIPKTTRFPMTLQTCRTGRLGLHLNAFCVFAHHANMHSVSCPLGGAQTTANSFQDAFPRISEMSFTHLLCSLGCCNEDYIPIGGLLLLQVAEGIGFEDWARCTRRFRNICRLKSNGRASLLVLLASDPDFYSCERIACT